MPLTELNHRFVRARSLESKVQMHIAALVGRRLYSRVRRLVGRQRLSPVRPWLTAVLFSLLVTLPCAARSPC